MNQSHVRPGLHPISLLLLLSIQLISCINEKENKTTHPPTAVTEVEIEDLSPVMGTSHYSVYYLDDLVMYRWNYMENSFVKDMADPNNKNSRGSSTVNPVYFVFQKDSSFGFHFDPKKGSMMGGRRSVDTSFARIKGTNKFDSFAVLKADTITWSADKNELREVYLLKMPAGMPAGYLVMYYSKRFNHVKESFNLKVDSIRRMKFYKHEVFFNSFYDERTKQEWPATKDATEMKEITRSLPDTVLHYFNLYKRSVQKTL
jgi:hypothetical protein